MARCVSHVDGAKKPKQPELFVPHTAPQAPGHRFYEKLNELLSSGYFDTFVEDLCAPYYDPDAKKGQVSIPPGTYFRMLLIGYFEGLESERGICWRCEDSLSLRAFLGLNLTDRVPTIRPYLGPGTGLMVTHLARFLPIS